MEGFVIENGIANFSICARCGQAIKHVFEFRGQIYGSECIKHVTGESVDYWVMKGNRIDEAATQERNERETKRQADCKSREVAFWQDVEKYTAENSWLISTLRGGGNFCESMSDSLAKCELNDKNFSRRCLQIMRDIYAKCFGRANSKKYWAACDDFDNRVKWSD